MVKRGEIWQVNLDPTVGSEIKKTRLCVVVSPDELNNNLRTVIVAPLTSKGFLAPFPVSDCCNSFGHKGLDPFRSDEICGSNSVDKKTGVSVC